MANRFGRTWRNPWRRVRLRCVPLGLLAISWLAVSPPISAGDPAERSRLAPAEICWLQDHTLEGKVLAGYQGWFTCEGDGAGLGWTHWTRDASRPLAAGNAAIDLWPDVSELGPDKQFATGFRWADGRPAEVFSSHCRETVLRHFRWMREAGIDGIFLQRFASELHSPRHLHHRDTVLAHCREGAASERRKYAVMYDLSGLPAGGVGRVREDWLRLQRTLGLAEDSAYLRHYGRPLVAVWGIGFSDGRRYSLQECRDLVAFFKEQGCSVMLGVPTYWRQRERDAVSDPLLHEVLLLADVISPWSVGRFATPEEACRHGEIIWRADHQWCRERSLEYLPVVFPGFSWHHLRGEAPLDQIPRRNGEFLWSQFVAARAAGVEAVYVAMFDEVDEGTAIFKCTGRSPQGPDRFVTYGTLPSDHYLWLTGEGGRLLRSRPKPIR